MTVIYSIFVARFKSGTTRQETASLAATIHSATVTNNNENKHQNNNSTHIWTYFQSKRRLIFV